MRESSVEGYLVEQVEALGGRCVKMNPTGRRGIPDRVAILPRGIVSFIELKRPKGGVVSATQVQWHIWLEERQHPVELLWSRGEVDDYVERVRKRMDDPEAGHGRRPGDEGSIA